MRRPEGWDAFQIAKTAPIKQDSVIFLAMVEAGADAMLQALIAKGVYVPARVWRKQDGLKLFDSVIPGNNPPGYLVFIEEDE